jgi:hypothetical protein
MIDFEYLNVRIVTRNRFDDLNMTIDRPSSNGIR